MGGMTADRGCLRLEVGYLARVGGWRLSGTCCRRDLMAGKLWIGLGWSAGLCASERAILAARVDRGVDRVLAGAGPPGRPDVMARATGPQKRTDRACLRDRIGEAWCALWTEQAPKATGPTGGQRNHGTWSADVVGQDSLGHIG